MTDPGFPDPRMGPRKQPPFLDHTFAVLGWVHRASKAVGSDRFAETVSRAEFYIDQAAAHTRTPGDEAIVAGLLAMLDGVIAANAQARVLLADSVSGMDAAEATEFVELIEAEDFPS